MSSVSFVRVLNQSYVEVKEAIERSLDLIKFNFNRNLKKIVIKPNMCYYYHPSTGDVTDPWYVGILIDVLREKFGYESEIFIVESDASAMKCRHAFRMLGYDKLAKEKDVKLVNLSEWESRVVDVQVNEAKFKFHIPELFYEADLVVNVPKPKYMRDVKITCALKNMFGCNAYPKKYVYHQALNEAIVGINKLIKTDLVVLDGLVVSGKYTKRLNLVMSGIDSVALDTAVAKMMGLDPRAVKHLVLASKERLGSLSFVAIGDYDYAFKEFPQKSFRDNAREFLSSLYLRVIRED